MKIGSEKNKNYTAQDFRIVLFKMLKEKISSNETCKDSRMPNFKAVSKYAKKNAGFRKELEKANEQLPYSVQAGAGRLPEKKFKKDLLSLKQS